jgi:dTDP-4-amino-4,6-dideoxygalactose transaminase
MAIEVAIRPAVSHIPFARSRVAPEALAAVERVLSSGWLTTGPEVAAFERDFADYVGAPHAVAVASCTTAIELSLRALGLPPGSRVLTPTMTFCGAVHAIVHAGLEPVLVDVDPDTLIPTADMTAAAAGQGAPEAMVVMHMAGYPAPVEELAEAAGLPLGRVIEDAAHALGTFVGRRRVGSISAATCFSFYATKNLPIGEGGMITTTDAAIEAHVRRARLHGMSRDAWKRYLPGSGWRYEVGMPGLKANMTDVQAAIGRAHLDHLPEWQAHRQMLADRYDSLLEGVPGIRRPPRPPEGRHAWHLYVIRVEAEYGRDRDELSAALAERGIDCSVHFIPTHHQPYFQRLLRHELPGADEAFSQILSLPLYQGLRLEDVHRVCAEISDLHVPAPAHAA